MLDDVGSIWPGFKWPAERIALLKTDVCEARQAQKKYITAYKLNEAKVLKIALYKLGVSEAKHD